jgi:hypothetical protein
MKAAYRKGAAFHFSRPFVLAFPYSQSLDFFADEFYLFAEDGSSFGAIRIGLNMSQERNAMKVQEEFQVKNAAGKTLPLQFVTPQLTYLDFGSARLPRGFQGYRVKDSATVAEKLSDGTFRITGSDEVYRRV